MTEKAKNSILTTATITVYRTDKYLQKELLADAFNKRKESETVQKLRSVQYHLDYALEILQAIKTE